MSVAESSLFRPPSPSKPDSALFDSSHSSLPFHIAVKDDLPISSPDTVAQFLNATSDDHRVVDEKPNSDNRDPPSWTDPEGNPTTGLARALTLSPSLLDNVIAPPESRPDTMTIPSANPSHLFWMPASQHPEIAPAEYEKYVAAHGLTSRRLSSVKRRASILSVSFTASDDEGDIQNENDELADRQAALELLERKVSRGPTTKTEYDADRTSRIRRSVSMQLPTDQSRVPESLVFDRNSSPLDNSRVLVPKADRPLLLRRGARTKFQRNSSLTAPSSALHARTSEDGERRWQNCRRSESAYLPSPNRLLGTTPPEGVQLTDLPVGFHTDHDSNANFTTPHDQVQALDVSARVAAAAASSIPASMSALTNLPTIELSPPTTTTPPSTPTTVHPPSPSRSTPERNKSAWSWSFWGDDKSKKPKPALLEEAPTTSAIESSINASKRFILSILFSRKPSQAKRSSDPSSGTTSQPPKNFALNKPNQLRFPLHVERTVYRQSHIKLANPRRPLHEQVLISNLMFWYLSVISHGPHDNDTPNSEPNKKARKMVLAANKKKKKQGKTGPRGQSRQQQQRQQKQQAQATKEDGVSLQHYMGGSRSSTGFVVPENYLRPQERKKQRALRQRRASLDDDDDDSDEESESSSEDEDDDADDDDNDYSQREPDRRRTPIKPQPRRPSGDKAAGRPDPKKEEEDNMPLALYKKVK